MQPKIDTISMKAAAKMLDIGPIVLRHKLQERDVFSSGKPSLPRPQYIHMGYFRTELTTYKTGDVDHYCTKALVTAKGIAFLRELLDEMESHQKQSPGPGAVGKRAPLSIVETDTN